MTIDWGNGQTETSSVSLNTSGSGTFSFDNPYLDDGTNTGGSFAYSITLSTTDDAGGTASTSSSMTVNNLDPTLSIDPLPATLDLQAPFTISGSVDDAGSDTLTVTIDWGNGDTTSITGLAAGDTFSKSYSYDIEDDALDYDDYNINVTLSDDDGGDDFTLTELPPDPEIDDLANCAGGTPVDVFELNQVAIVICRSFDTFVAGGGHGWHINARYLPLFRTDPDGTEYDIVQSARHTRNKPGVGWQAFIPSAFGTDRYDYFHDVQSSGHYIDVVPENGDEDDWSPYWTDHSGGKPARK